MLLVAYDGSAYKGFAPQPGLVTVGGELARVLSTMVGAPVVATCAGRTDTGVHAAGQVVHVDVPSHAVDRWQAEDASAGTRATRAGAGPRAADGATAGSSEAGAALDPELLGLARSLTRQLGPSMAVPRARLAVDGFDARRSAVGRRYRYEILRTVAPDPLRRRTTWHMPEPLDLGALRIGADALLGTHDFSAFCKRPVGEEGPLTRRVADAGWRVADDGALLVFEIEANAFCHHMVRSIVGTLVSAGEGRVTAATVRELLRTGDRHLGGRVAPPEGLRLLAVRYPEELVPGGTLQPPSSEEG
jgi:tRNA pseudouridine38-40 synthase